MQIMLNVLEDAWRESLYLFSKEACGYQDITKRTHGDTIRVLESEGDRKLIVLPRGTFKSSLCSVAFPIWRLLKDSNIRILIDSEIYTNSKNFLREIKAHLESPLLTKVYGVFKTSDNWNEGEITISQRKKIRKEASITAGGVETEKTGQHYDLIICDDLNSPNNSKTPEARKKVIDHYKYLQAILEPTGTMVVVGTRYADDDIIGWILKNEVNINQERAI
jgi:hypothetical protein